MLFFWGSKCIKTVLFLGLFLGHFFSDFQFEFSTFGTPNRCFRREGIAQIDFSGKSFLENFLGLIFYNVFLKKIR